MNGVLAAMFAAAAPRRALEIGAGTGGTTRPLLAAHQPDEYLFTDVSSTLLRRARKRLPQVATAAFDVERDPASQGLEPGRYQAVIAANVLHATRDLDAAIANARALLAPGGVLLLWEAERPETWFDLSIAFLPGWNRHADAHRQDGPLVPAEVWEARLAAAGLAAGSIRSDGHAAIAGVRPPD
jgi:SAM-dependent methyltransferase